MIFTKVLGDKETSLAIEIMAQQMPYAASRAVNNTAYGIMTEVRAKVPTWVHTTRDFLQRSVVYNKSTVTGKNQTQMTAYTGFLNRVPLIKLFEYGGVRAPFTAKSIAVPVDIRRTNSGAIPRSQRPRYILNRKNTFIDKIGRVTGVWQNKRGQALKLLYIFKRRTTYGYPHFHFFDTASSYVSKNFSTNMSDEMANEIAKTAIKRSK